MADRKRILIVDDDPDLVSLLKADLEHRGYRVAAAADGREALALADAERFDLLLLDIMMPGTDGYRVANAIASRRSERPPKIILMTCRDARREKGLAVLTGAAAMVQKPFALETLHKKISAVLESR